MELTKEEKDFIIEMFSKLTFNIDSIDKAVLAKGIIEKAKDMPEQKNDISSAATL